MSKAIKVEDQVYLQLDNLRGKGETFSMAIQDLLKARLQVLELINALEGQLKFREWQNDRLKALQAADR